MIDPRDIEELVGSAMNAGSLRMTPDAERALDRVAAFAMASRRAAHRRPGRAPTDKDLIDAALGVQLWHATHLDRQAPHAAARLLAVALLLRPIGQSLRAEPERLNALAVRVVAEWLHKRCLSCGGAGVQEIVDGRRWKPRAMMRNATLLPCTACGGEGMARVDHMARRQAIGDAGARMDRERYQAKWLDAFRLAAGLCDMAAGGLRAPTWRALRPARIRA